MASADADPPFLPRQCCAGVLRGDVAGGSWNVVVSADADSIL